MPWCQNLHLHVMSEASDHLLTLSHQKVMNLVRGNIATPKTARWLVSGHIYAVAEPASCCPILQGGLESAVLSCFLCPECGIPLTELRVSQSCSLFSRQAQLVLGLHFPSVRPDCTISTSGQTLRVNYNTMRLGRFLQRLITLFDTILHRAMHVHHTMNQIVPSSYNSKFQWLLVWSDSHDRLLTLNTLGS